MELEVLIATRNQQDMSLPEKMNISRPVVIANQCGQWGYEQQGSTRMLRSDTAGIGINRNLALMLGQGEILLFADDDVTYYDSTLQPVVDAFRQHPRADVIIFGLDKTRDGQIEKKYRETFRRRRWWNLMRFGACRIAIRRSALERANVRFSHLFGAAKYGSGEDTLFLYSCLRAGLRIYSHPYVLGGSAMDSSSWFTGHNEKSFFDRGALMAALFPRMKHLMKWHIAIKFSKQSDLSLSQAVRWMDRGIRAYKKGTTFADETTS